MRAQGADTPLPLPVQALDHATGYLMAASVVHAVLRRLDSGYGSQARLSLTRTAKLLIDLGRSRESTPFPPEGSGDRALEIEQTSWNPAQRLLPPVAIDGAPMHWRHAASELGSAALAVNLSANHRSISSYGREVRGGGAIWQAESNGVLASSKYAALAVEHTPDEMWLWRSHHGVRARPHRRRTRAALQDKLAAPSAVSSRTSGPTPGRPKTAHHPRAHRTPG